MVSQSSSAALNAILSESSNEVDGELEVGIRSDEDAELDSEGLQDCEIVESLQSCKETDVHNNKNRLQSTPSATSAVSLLSILKAPCM